MTKRLGPSTQLLCAVVLLNALGIQCVTHVIDRGSREKVKSEVVSQEQRLELVSEPTQDDPVAKFRSLEEIRYRETFQLTTVFKREPASWLTWGLIGTGVGAFLLSRDMQNRGYPQYARPTLTTAFFAAGGAVVCYLLPRFDFRKVERTRETRIDLKPLPVDVSIGTQLLTSMSPDAQCYAEFSLLTYLDMLPRGRDFNVAGQISSMPQCSASFAVGKNMIPLLENERRAEAARRERIEKELRLAEERKKQEEREAQRQKEQALSEIVGSLDAWDVAQLQTSFRYASAGFQYLATRGALSKTLGVNSYGDFLDLPLMSQVWAVREIARVHGGGGYTGSLVIQELLSIPAYLAEKILR